MNDVAIIGAGPAGVAAAIQLKRFGINPVLYEEKSVGGLIRNANLIESYPGFPNGISGVQFVKLLDDHLNNLNIEVRYEAVNSISYDEPEFQIRTNKGTLSSRFIILASGTLPITSDVQGVSELIGANVFYEVYPLYTARGRQIVIVGAGDAAFDYGLNLGQHNSVIIYNRGQNASCLPLLIKRARQNKNIVYRKNHILKRVMQTGNILDLFWETNGRNWREKADYLLFAIGRTPNLSYLDDSVSKKLTSLEASGLLHVIGDVKNGKYRQASISVGDGVKAAMAIADKLKS